MKLRTRIILSFMSVALLVVLVGFANLKLNEQRESLFTRSCSIADIEIELNRAIAAHSVWVKNVFEFIVLQQSGLSVEVDPQKCVFGKLLFAGALDVVKRDFPTIAVFLEESKAPHAKLHGAAHKIKESWDAKDYAQSRDKFVKIFEAEISPALKELGVLLQKAVDEGKKIEMQMREEIKKNEAMSEKITLAVIILAFILTVLVGNKVTQRIAGPVGRALTMAQKIQSGDISGRLNLDLDDEIGKMAEAMDQMSDILEEQARMLECVAGGDLTVEVQVASEKDRLGMALKTMVQSLGSFLSKVKDSAIQLESSAFQISDASNSLAQGATESSASLEEISASMTEIDSQTRVNADNAKLANGIATQTKTAAENGNNRMSELMGAVNAIKESSAGIAKIIKVIDDIAFQTNLLALNAAVEAARAGRHGKGFAVVAEEVRNLAGRSAKAARETSDMIENSMIKIDSGFQIAQNTESALQEIVQSSVKVADLVAEISLASHEQAEKISQINTGLRQIDDVTQLNSANSEETASASVDLSSQAKELSKILGQFKLLEK